MEKELSIKEKEKIIEIGLKNGATYGEMQKQIGEKSSYTVNEIRKKLLNERKITKQVIADGKMKRKIMEWKNDEQFMKVLEYTKAGLSQMDIVILLDCSYNYVRDCIKNLKMVGWITDEEIAEARENYKEEEKEDNLVREQIANLLKKGITKNQFASSIGMTERGVYNIEQDLIQEGKITKQEIDEAVSTYGRDAQKRNKVIELLKKGYTYSEISREVDYGRATIKKIKEQFIEASDFSEEEYQRLRKKRQEENKNNANANEKNDLLEDEVLQLLLKGKTADIIKKKTKLPTCDIKLIISRLKRQKRITQEEIKEAIEKDKQKVERMILQFLKEGYSQRTIVSKFPEDEMTLDMVQTYIKRIKESGEITDEEIKKYKDEAAKQREKESRDFILEGLKKGLSMEKIACSSNGRFSKDKVKDIVKKLKEDGTVTQRQILEWKKQKKEKDQEIADEKRGEIDNQIIDWYDRGYLQQEIADKIGKSLSFVGRRIREIEEKRPFDKEKIKKARLQREKEMQKEERSNQKYRSLVKSAQKTIELERQYSPQLCRTLLLSMKKREKDGTLLEEDLEVLAQLFLLEKPEVEDVLSVGKLYANRRDYRGSLRFLKQGIDFFEGKERNIMNTAISSIKHSLALETAVEMLYSGEYTIQEICAATKLLETEVLTLRKRKIGKETENNRGGIE